MGMVLTEANRPHTGEYHYRKVIELMGRRDPITVANLAWNLKNQGRMEEARGLYEEAAAATPICIRCSAGRAWKRPTATSTAPRIARPRRAGRADNPSICCRAPSFTAAA